MNDVEKPFSTNFKTIDALAISGAQKKKFAKFGL